MKEKFDHLYYFKPKNLFDRATPLTTLHLK